MGSFERKTRKNKSSVTMGLLQLQDIIEEKETLQGGMMNTMIHPYIIYMQLYMPSFVTSLMRLQIIYCPLYDSYGSLWYFAADRIIFHFWEKNRGVREGNKHFCATFPVKCSISKIIARPHLKPSIYAPIHPSMHAFIHPQSCCPIRTSCNMTICLCARNA